MKLASYLHSGIASYGVVRADGIVDLGRRLGARFPGLRNLLAAGQLDHAREIASSAAPDLLPTEVTWLPVVPDPERILCVGLNYKMHVQEVVGRSMPTKPVIFLRLPSSQTAHLGPIMRPRVSQDLDFEGELAVIVGSRGRYIEARDAMRHVAGYSIYNDASVRDWQRHSHQYTPGKNFPSTGAFGPWMVTADEIPSPKQLTLTTRVNGVAYQQGRLSDLIFSIEELIAYLSSFTELAPGDVIVTGTPEGVGSLRQPPVWLRPGDTVEVEINGIGTLQNTVVQEL